jgi:hypothetical protein
MSIASRWQSVCYVEALKFPGKILPLQIHMIDDRHIRPFAAPIQNSIHCLSGAFKDSLDRAVGPVAHPARHIESFSSTLCFHAEKNALDPAGYDDMSTYLFFHENKPPGACAVHRAFAASFIIYKPFGDVDRSAPAPASHVINRKRLRR